MDHAERFLLHRVAEEWIWIKLHTDPDATEADVLAYLRSQCGLTEPRQCRYAPSEYCVLDCPYRPEDL